MNQPQPADFPQWAGKYIQLVEGDVLTLMDQQAVDVPNFINNLVGKADYAYAPGKWTLRELAGHLIDTERVLAYRMLCIARGEQADLPGFDEDAYVVEAHFQNRSLFSIGEEFALLRRANMCLIRSFTEADLKKQGTANGLKISVHALVFVLAGHVIHHQNIIRERYL